MRPYCFCGCLRRPEDGGGSGAAPETAGPADPALIDELVVANHILFDQGVVDGFGHISVRHDKRADRFLLARSMAPRLVGADDIMEYELGGAPVDSQGRLSYLERFIHGEIYRLRPEVMSVVHSHSPSVIPFGVSAAKLRPIYHMSGFLRAEGAKVFEIREAGGPATDMLITSRELGAALARSLGEDAVVLMRGHGSTTVAPSIRLAVFRAVYAEMNARLQSDAMRLGEVTFLNAAEAASAASTHPRTVERPWALWRQQVAGR